MENDKNLHFFLGANTPQGFVSRFDQLADIDLGWRVFVIKGGPGSGKSTLMKKISAAFEDEPLEIIHCSSDVHSLDGVIIPGKKAGIADGTNPHAIEPAYPGVLESLVDMTSCWDADRLYLCREEIIRLFRSISKCHEFCCRFLSAASSLMGDTHRMALECVNIKKISRYCDRLAKQELKPNKNASPKESVRFLSAVTNLGIHMFSETAEKLCDRIYIINDDHGAVSRLLLNLIRSKALSAGYDVIACYCPLSPFDKLEHLFIPKLGLGFMTSNRFHRIEILPHRVINSQRFTDNNKLKTYKRRFSFNRKAAGQMVDQAARLLAEAKSLHDELEHYYIEAMDFTKADAKAQEVINTIKKWP